MVPKAALIPAIPGGPSRGLPASAAEFLARERVPFVDGYRFLGIDRSAAYEMARRYVKRTSRLAASGKPFDLAQLRPKRDAAGRWHEIPAYQVGHKYMCRTELLVAMVYPEAVGR